MSVKGLAWARRVNGSQDRRGDRLPDYGARWSTTVRGTTLEVAHLVAERGEPRGRARVADPWRAGTQYSWQDRPSARKNAVLDLDVNK
jgi:hypothetical protein